MKPLDDFDKVIKRYLDKRAESDEQFAISYAKQDKSINECCSFILGEARKKGNTVVMSDDEVYGLAVHYYDEDNIKINKLPANSKAAVSKTVQLTEEEEKIAKEAAIKRLADEQYKSMRKKSSKAKKDDVQQMTLF